MQLECLEELTKIRSVTLIAKQGLYIYWLYNLIDFDFDFGQHQGTCYPGMHVTVADWQLSRANSGPD